MSPDRSKATIDLGKQLIEKLACSDDMLAAWMAHDIAGLIKAAEEAGPEQAAAANEACRAAIVMLWQHRNALPESSRPLGDLEPVLRTLAALDLKQMNRYRYIGGNQDDLLLKGSTEDQRKWLQAAQRLDYAARALMQYFLRASSEPALASARQWVELARLAGADVSREGLTLDYFCGSDPKTLAGTDAGIEALKEQIAKLQMFVELAGRLAEDQNAALRLPNEGR